MERICEGGGGLRPHRLGLHLYLRLRETATARLLGTIRRARDLKVGWNLEFTWRRLSGIYTIIGNYRALSILHS
jgi:hypothetical protein